MKNSERYYLRVKALMDDRAEINGEYETGIKKIEQYKGSDYYRDTKKKLTAERDAAIAAMREKHGLAFREIIKEMRDKASSRTVVAPTPDQLAVLQALKMRNKVDLEELKQAARTMTECPLALSVLTEIAHDNGHPGISFNKELTPDYISKKIDNLERSSWALLRGENVPVAGRYPESLSDCLTRCGYIERTLIQKPTGQQDAVINEELIRKFCEAVDGREN